MHQLNITKMVQNEAEIDLFIELYNKRSEELKSVIDKYNQKQVLMQNQLQREILSETFIADFNLKDVKWKSLIIESHEKSFKLLNDFKDKQLMVVKSNASLRINSFTPPMNSTQINEIQPVNITERAVYNFAASSKHNSHLPDIETNDTNYQCDFDGRIFPNRAELLEHMLQHDPNWCKICKKN
ncbi:hypothetical protein PVAND_008588 [Polypedilum vanderplanki]|uniref:C2H2-type domain-containing protein n=1 Tax=Polypedilum vanderplanki TaxID=319348 RepID=A0A9J6CAP1_POLVA|nr:hypothetical protein PVAND_008588 [Polypedilum vanderplanki]